MFNPMKYFFKTHPAERYIYKRVGYVAGAVLLFVLLLDASALGLVVFFAIGWYAREKYDFKQKKVVVRKKKVVKQT